MPSIETPFVSEDLTASTVPQWVGVSAVGSGPAYVRSRRVNGLVIFNIEAHVTDTTVFTSQIEFTMRINTATAGPIADGSNASLWSAAAHVSGVSGGVYDGTARLGLLTNGTMIVIPIFGNAALTATNPKTLVAGDWISVSGVVEAFDN